MAITNQLHNRMRRAVPPERIPELEGILSQYDGRVDFLGHFLDTFGSDNPWSAAANARVLNPTLRRQSEGRVELGRNPAGQTLYWQEYVLAHWQDGTRVWTSGAQAITKIMEAFGSDKQKRAVTREGAQKAVERQDNYVQRDEVKYSLDELLADPEKLSDVHSRNVRERVYNILEINQELVKQLKMLDRVRYGASAQEGERHFLIAAEPGVGFYRFFEEQENLPTGIRDIYQQVTALDRELPTEDRRFMMGALIAYAARNMHINRAAVLGGFQEDLDFLTALAEKDPTHPVIERFGAPDLRKVRDLLGKHEVTLLEATAIVEAYPVDRVRATFNGALQARYEQNDGIKGFLTRMEPLFFSEGKMRADSLSPRVPMDRLKETLYYGVLDRDDFFLVKEYLRLQVVSKNEEREAMSIGEFANTMNGLVLAARKVAYLTAQLDGVMPRNPEQVKAAKTLRETHRKPFQTVETFEREYGMSVNELIARFEDKHPYDSLWSNRSTNLREHATFGLYVEDNKLGEMVERVRGYRSLDELALEAPRAVTLIEQDRIEGGLFLHRVPKYMNKKTYDLIVTMEDSIPDMDVTPDEHLAAQKAEFQYRRRLNGSIENSLEVRRERFDLEPFWVKHGDVKIFDYSLFGGFLEDITENAVLANTEWMAKAEFLTQVSSRVPLARANLQPSSTQTWHAIKDVTTKDYVHIELFNGVNRAYKQIVEGVEPLEGVEEFDSYKVRLEGTTPNLPIRQTFDELSWNGERWEPYKQAKLLGVQVWSMQQRVTELNGQHGSSVRLVHEKV